MNCPNCGAKLTSMNQKYCEFCGVELEVIESKPMEQETKKTFTIFSKRRCC
ncbi:MAG: zinc-ribbon domain-containing protein [Promethearchaeota archaeon]|nr:MAG: zinc-ribbon domain-containing protein [Candidatus Lokiarchaeota archaeon]